MSKKLNPKPVPAVTAKQQPAGAVAQKENGLAKFLTLRNMCILLAVISFATYANTLRNGFVYDDVSVVTGNKVVTKGVSAIPEIFATNYRHGFYTVVLNDLYRPLSLVMFATEYQFFGANPAPYHLFNILLFMGCVILLFLFLDKFFEQKKTSVAFIAALLFALHPIHTEVVANIKSCDELLCFFFAFLSLNIFTNYIRSGKTSQFVLGTFCFLVSMFSKETVITFLAVVPLIFFFYRNENTRRSAYITASVFAVAIFFLLVRSHVLAVNNANHSKDIFFIDNFLVSAPSAAVAFATEMSILGLYIKLLFIPHPLICDYTTNSYPYFGFDNPGVLVSLVIYCALAVVMIRGLIKRSKDPYVFSIAFFLITIALFSNIPFLIGTAVGERLLFFPSVGFCLVIALLIEKFLAAKGNPTSQLITQPKVLAVVIPISVIYLVLSVSRNGDWISDNVLFATDIVNVPNNCRMNHNMGIVTKVLYNAETDPAKRKELLDLETSYFRKALEAYPNYDKSNIEMGLICYGQNRFRDAIKYFKTANEQDPLNLDPPYNLGACYLGLSMVDSGLSWFNLALGIDPNYADALVGKGTAFLNTNRYDSAILYFTKAINIKPDNAMALVDLGVVYFNQQKYPEAITQYKKALAVNPSNLDACSNLGRAYFNTHLYTDAITTFLKEIALNPQSTGNLTLIAYSWQQLGKMDSARRYEAIAQRSNPGFKL